MSEISPIVPSGLLGASQYDALTPAQQTAANGAQTQVQDTESILQSLSGGNGNSSEVLNSIGVNGSNETAASISDNTILTGLVDSDDLLPTNIFQLNLLESLSRAQAAGSAADGAAAAAVAVTAPVLQTYTSELTGTTAPGSSVNVSA